MGPRPTHVVIVDVCLYAGELDMLELRLRTLAPVVDLFVVVTCSSTHQGEPAGPPALPGGPDLPVPFVHEVVPSVHYPIGERGGVGSPLYQAVEREHRDGALRAAYQVADGPDTIVMVSDVDEIPNPHAVSALPELLDMDEMSYFTVTFEQRFHSSALNLLHPQQPWFGTCASRMRALRPQEMRDARATVGTDHQSIGVIARGGWHMSWLGTDAERQRKLDTFSHAELRGSDPAVWRAREEHANGEPLRHLNLAETQELDWPLPLLDGTFSIPPSWIA